MSHLHPLTAPLPAPAPASVPAPCAGLRVSLVPFLADNPYQRALASELEQLGIDVRPAASLKAVVREARHRSTRPDVVHLHWLPHFKGTALNAARFLMFLARVARLRASGLKIVWTVHNLYTHEVKHRRVERLFIRTIVRFASRLIVHSTGAADLVRREFAVKEPRKIAVVPHGHYLDCYPNTISRAEARHRLRLRDDAPVFLFFGKIRPYKGVRSLIRAFETVAPSDATLLIAGSPYTDRIWRDLQQTVHSPSVQLHGGFVADHDVQMYMNAADAVILPYQNVLTSGAVILAMSFGRACVAPRLGCLPDVLDDEGAVLYDPHSPHGLARALQDAFAQRDRLAAMGAHNRERAREWRWDEIARATASIYEVAKFPTERPGIQGSATECCGSERA